MAGDEIGTAARFGSTAAMAFRRSSADDRWRTGFSSQLRIQWRRRRPKATTDVDERLGWRHGGDGGAPVHDDGQSPVGFGEKQPAAGIELDFAEPREVAALTGDGRGDGALRLERRPEVEREGERGESVSGDGGGRDLRTTRHGSSGSSPHRREKLGKV
uniref:DUF834 domain-containing protein n=1 Tax=Oryza sativa subsp. japonica TaxID=39947 RepID=Q5Z556_ORYSJ|nr:hypothetical protein [Oryza sativa Japonica Group]